METEFHNLGGGEAGFQTFVILSPGIFPRIQLSPMVRLPPRFCFFAVFYSAFAVLQLYYIDSIED